MMIAEMDPFAGSPLGRPALAGLAPLTALDAAERLITLVHDERCSAAERARALAVLPRLNPSLGVSAASSLITDSAGAVRRAARSVLREHRARVDLEPEPDAVA